MDQNSHKNELSHTWREIFPTRYQNFKVKDPDHTKNKLVSILTMIIRKVTLHHRIIVGILGPIPILISLIYYPRVQRVSLIILGFVYSPRVQCLQIANTWYLWDGPQNFITKLSIVTILFLWLRHLRGICQAAIPRSQAAFLHPAEIPFIPQFQITAKLRKTIQILKFFFQRSKTGRAALLIANKRAVKPPIA